MGSRGNHSGTGGGLWEAEGIIFVSPCIPNVEHQYYGTAHFKQTLGFTPTLSPLLSTPKVASSEPVDPLLDAILHNDLEALMKIESIPSTPILPNKLTPLHLAAKRGFDEIIKHLLQRDPTMIDARDSDGETALFKAAGASHTLSCTYLILKGAGVANTDIEGYTPLHQSCASGNVSTVRLLIESGAPVNAKSRTGITPIMLACIKGHVDIVQLLLTRTDLDLAVTCEGGESAACFSAQSGEGLYLYDMLIAKGAKNALAAIDIVNETQKSSGGILTKLTWVADGWTDIRTGVSKTLNSVILPEGWFWLTEWAVDISYPNLGDNGWERLEQKDASFLTPGKRRRRWFRVRKKIARLPSEDTDYLCRAESMFADSLPNGDLFDSHEDLDKSFAVCQDVVEVLLSGIKDDLDSRRKGRAVALVEKYLTDAEALKDALERRKGMKPDPIRLVVSTDSPGPSSNEVVTSPTMQTPSISSASPEYATAEDEQVNPERGI